jgi:hypothetical protein
MFLSFFAGEHQLLLEFQEVSFITDQSAWRERIGRIFAGFTND